MGFIWKTYKDQVKFDRYFLPGLTPRSLRHHKSLLLLHACTVGCIAWACYMTGRTLIYNPDSLVTSKENYERYRDGSDYKLLNITGFRPKCKAPIYKREGDPSDESYALPDY